jgi:hypothetical protein
MSNVSSLGCLASGSAMSEWWLSQSPDPPSLKDQGLLSEFSVWGVCLGSASAFPVRIFRLGCLSGFCISVSCQDFSSGVFVWVLRW